MDNFSNSGNFSNFSNFNVLSLIFLNQKHDLRFVFKFRKICKWSKSYSEEWLTDILNNSFLDNVDITVFKNLRKLQCSDAITNEQLQQLHNLVYLNISDTKLITNDGIKHLNLHTLFS